jgi:hypothetical protein
MKGLPPRVWAITIAAPSRRNPAPPPPIILGEMMTLSIVFPNQGNSEIL